MDNFGTLIKALRARENMTQKDFADKLKTSCTTVSKWENNKSYPDITTLRDISRILNVTCDELLNPDQTLKQLDAYEEIEAVILTDEPIDSNQTPVVSAETPSEQTEAPKVTVSVFSKVPSRKIFLSFILVLVFAIFAAGYYIYERNHFKYLHTFANHSTLYGDAYELAYCHKVKSSNEVFLTHADAIKNDWKKGKYPDSTSELLIVSYYLSEDDFESKAAPYFRAYFSDVNSVAICKAISYEGNIIPDSTITVSEEVRGRIYVGTLRLHSYTHGPNDTTATYKGELVEE